MLHRNEPGLISAITSVTTEAGLNIENMVNKGKKDMAYTMLDATGSFKPELAEKLEEYEDEDESEEYEDEDSDEEYEDDEEEYEDEYEEEYEEEYEDEETDDYEYEDVYEDEDSDAE